VGVIETCLGTNRGNAKRSRRKTDRRTTRLGKPYEPNAIIKNDIEYILMERKPGGYRKPTEEQRKLSMIPKDKFDRWFQQFWNLTGASTKEHPAQILA
jgi:site-specific DNA-methyltransferase (adenine-specific)